MRSGQVPLALVLRAFHVQVLITSKIRVIYVNLIINTGFTFLRTPHSKFLLTRVLHCPNVAANLLSINRFCLDNDCFFILTGTHFLIKANLTSKTILEGPSINDLYTINL
jgi:hypothetical protein